MKKLVSLLLTALLLLTLVPMPALAADAEAHYLVEGRTEGGGFVVEVRVPELDVISGALALTYDTSKLKLQGGDSIKAIEAASDVSVITDHVEETELVNAEKGVVGFAWYTFGLEDGFVATLRFSFVDGSTERDLDAASLRLRCVPERGFGAWTSAASLSERTSGVVPRYYDYLSDTVQPLSVTFDYPGAGKVPEAARSVVVRCRNAFGKAVRAEMEVNNASYSTDSKGDLHLPLVDGDYLYRVSAAGYGTKKGTLQVSGDTEETLTFTTDAELVEQARQELEISFAAGDSAESVTKPLGLRSKTESGVEIAWTSSVPARVGSQGSVFRPPHGTGDVTVELTAVLSHGKAKAEKQFTVKVLELEPNVIPGKPGSAGVTDPELPEEPISTGVFSDVGESGYAWAQEAVEALAEAGIIQGTGNGAFSPAAPIKRADFVLLLSRMMDLSAIDISGTQSFSDVPAGSYYHDAVLQARALGVAQGSGSNRFHPASPITRQEMAVFTVRALQATDYYALGSRRVNLSTFVDGIAAASWAQDSLSLLAGHGFLAGYQGALTPQANTNRAQAAVFLYRIYQAAGR